MTDQDKILQLLRTAGPSLPTKVAKVINTNILLASAHLSDLSSQGKVKISQLKIGGSPLYYLPGQESQLYHFAFGNINPKDLHVLEQLKGKKVVREAGLDLLSKVALRELKDFAVPLHVNIDGNKELFWKWSLLSEEETNKVISELLQKFAPLPEEKVELVVHAGPSAPLDKLVIEPKPEPQSEKNRGTSFVPPSTLIKEEVKIEKKPLLQKVKVARKKKEDEFFPVIENYLSKLNIQIEQKETIRKNAELNLLLNIPSAVGKTVYFCKAKQKNKCDEKDLSAAYMETQAKKLPLLFLYTGEINKKAEEMLDSGAFENVVVKKIE